MQRALPEDCRVSLDAQLSNSSHPALDSSENEIKEENTMAEIRKAPQSTQSGTGRGDYHFRCADVGFTGCNWETRGSSPDEVLRNAEQHGREKHNLTNLDEETRNKVRSKITRAA
jgi:predicted small metal-binding protein